MIVVEVLGPSKLRVIHFYEDKAVSDTKSDKKLKAVFKCKSDKAIIKWDDFDVYPHEYDVYRVDHSGELHDIVYSGEKAIKRARKKIGEMGYNFLFNNCESFCTWVKVDKTQSEEAERAMFYGVVTIIIGLVIVVGVSVYIYNKFRKANKKSSNETTDVD